MSGLKNTAFHRDDIAIWPDGFWATLGEIREGGYGHRSDDYEVVRLEDIDRLRELGIAEDMDLA